MRFFDPQRPQSDGILLGQWPASHGGGTFGLPVLYVEPATASGPDEPGAVPDASWLVTAHMPMSSGGFSGFQAKFSSCEELAAFQLRWLEDPERELLETFRYDPSLQRRKEAGRKIIRERVVSVGLAALGLDD